ncbi:MAG: PadR family transcriptional regulator [Dehalococcoidia bacterium]|nr:PadR family transcriptional regulator [Dehalococcoidia bacterium]
MLLLAIVGWGPAHGYAIIEQLRQRSGAVFDLSEGTVYPALHRLEGTGLLASEWTAGAGRRRRVYSLTARGREALRQREQDWQGYARAVTAVLGGST